MGMGMGMERERGENEGVANSLLLTACALF
jgi:hypothetical protein